MQAYLEDDYLQLSGLQHFLFCPRQWALIHVENQWKDNYLSMRGRVMHDKVHNETKLEKRGKIVIARGLRVSSVTLGLSGQCDVVEFIASEKGVRLQFLDGLYKLYPVEYKRGIVKLGDCDRVQLCAQAMCLEEMCGCKINEGAIFYGEPRRREKVAFSEELRKTVIKTLELMHDYKSRNFTPKAIKKRCYGCSLKDVCLPQLNAKENIIDKYFESSML